MTRPTIDHAWLRAEAETARDHARAAHASRARAEGAYLGLAAAVTVIGFALWSSDIAPDALGSGLSVVGVVAIAAPFVTDDFIALIKPLARRREADTGAAWNAARTMRDLIDAEGLPMIETETLDQWVAADSRAITARAEGAPSRVRDRRASARAREDATLEIAQRNTTAIHEELRARAEQGWEPRTGVRS